MEGPVDKEEDEERRDLLGISFERV